MIIVRDVLQAKFGQGAALAKAMGEWMPRTMASLSNPGRWRLLTDLSGPFDTVVLEIEVESLAAWERDRTALFASPAFQEQAKATYQLIASGHQELYTLEATS